MAFSFSPKIVTDGLVLALDAANPRSYLGSGTTWSDLTANGNNATLTNGPTFNSSNGGSIQFDGTNDYVTSINASIYNNLTIDMWIYDTRGQIQRDILTYNDNLGSYTLGSFGYGQIFRTDGNGLVGRTFFSADTVPSNSWYRFCYVKNGDLYINMTRYTGTGTDRTYGILKFGNSRNDVGSFLQGFISNIKVYNRSLSAQEVLQNYNATKSRFNLT